MKHRYFFDGITNNEQRLLFDFATTGYGFAFLEGNPDANLYPQQDYTKQSGFWIGGSYQGKGFFIPCDALPKQQWRVATNGLGGHRSDAYDSRQAAELAVKQHNDSLKVADGEILNGGCLKCSFGSELVLSDGFAHNDVCLTLDKLPDLYYQGTLLFLATKQTNLQSKLTTANVLGTACVQGFLLAAFIFRKGSEVVRIDRWEYYLDDKGQPQRRDGRKKLEFSHYPLEDEA